MENKEIIFITKSYLKYFEAIFNKYLFFKFLQKYLQRVQNRASKLLHFVNF